MVAPSRMSEQDFGQLDASGEQVDGAPPIQPYREEHDSGGSRFRELLARAKGEGGSPPPSSEPRRPLPPGGPINYDDDVEWEERVIGSPDLPDLPLKNEMPGLRIAPEMDIDGPPAGEGGAGGEGGGGVGGGRFQRMMQQAQMNDQRQAAGVPPRGSTPPGSARPAPVSKKEKERALRAAVERQQRMMAKARGVDLDDPNLEGAALQRKKALSRAQAEQTSGGYLPSSSASDDYFATLTADSSRRHREQRARLEGRSIPDEEPVSPPLHLGAETSYEAPSGTSIAPAAPMAGYPEKTPPQKRTRATRSIQNSSDAYIASLKGLKVDIPRNPFLNEEGELVTPGEQKKPPVVLPPPTSVKKPAPPAGPSVSYAEKLRLAREGKGGRDAARPKPEVDDVRTSTAGDTSVVAATTPSAPQAPPRPSYAERLSEARQAKSANADESVASSPLAARAAIAGAPPLVATVASPAAGAADPAFSTSAPAPPSARKVFEQDSPSVAPQAEDDVQAKMMRVMNLLTEHKTAGLVGEDRVADLRNALVDTREALRAETYGRSVPPTMPSSSVSSVPVASTAPGTSSSPTRTPTSESSPQSALSDEDADVMRRCGALLMAHTHSSVAAQELEALREGLASSLRIVEAQLGGCAVSSGGDSLLSASAPPDVPAGARGAQGRGDGGVGQLPGSMQSVGSILSGMDVSKKPETFAPEDDSDGDKSWTGGSLGEYEMGVGTRALGYLLKHRGGKGYGRGRVRGAEAEQMVSTLAELTDIMQEEMVDN